jgi:glycosyltransferase involved in cell wall biosynthesis
MQIASQMQSSSPAPNAVVEAESSPDSAAAHAPRYSVIIPAYNAARDLEACLNALLEQRLPATEYEVIVVDDGSTDGTGDLALLAGARVIRQPNRGPAAARNAGMRAARAGIVCFTDADCAPTRDWVARIVAPLTAPGTNVVAVKGAYSSRQSSVVARFVQQEYMDRYDRLRQQQRIDHVDTGAAAYNRDVVLSIGGFDEAFTAPSVEDQDLSFRLAKAGHSMVFVPEAVVEHRHPESVRRYFRRKFILGVWKVREFTKHPDKTISDSYTPQALKVQTALAMILLVSAIVPLLWPVASLCVLAFLMSAAPFMGKVRRRDPGILWAVPPLLLVRGMAGGFGMIYGLAGLLTGRQHHP